MNAAEVGRGRARTGTFASVATAARAGLCALFESPGVRSRHVGALVAFSPQVRRTGPRLLIRFEHGPTALWLRDALASHNVEELLVGEDGSAAVSITNPQIVLGRYGYRDGRWKFGLGDAASLGISRGAVHAAGMFGRAGLSIACPTAPMMLTLAAVMARSGMPARPSEGDPRVVVSSGQVSAVLTRLGLAEAAAQYRRLRETPMSGNGTHA